MTLLTAEPHHADVSTPHVLEARGLHVAYGPATHQHEVVHAVELTLKAGQTLALVGQSGSGKSTIALAISGLLPPTGHITRGTVHIAGRDVTRFSRRDWRQLRGTQIGYIPQDPLSSLDPLQSVGRQLEQALLLHTSATRRTVRTRAIELLDRVGIRHPQRCHGAYPHEISGGQLQRVLIAIAIAGHPSLLIADEPTSALDVTVQKTILDLLGDLQNELKSAILLITHDLALAGDRSDTMVVLKDGIRVDSGPTRSLLSASTSDYTRRLFADAPATNPHRYRSRSVDATQSVPDPRTATHPRGDAENSATTPDAITVHGLTKYHGNHETPTLDGVGFTVRKGSIHALVGESGSGKTTIARVLAGLESFTSGTVGVESRSLDSTPRHTNKYARQLQLVHQNPLSALDPRFSVRRSIEEPLLLHRSETTMSSSTRDARVREVLEQVALPENLLERRPHEISGGQRQRVAIARALVLAPHVLILDEPTSALDVTVQAQIIELLLQIRTERELTYLFISHDLSLVRQIADDVTVLNAGKVVESSSVQDIFHHSRETYTRRLIESIPGTAI